MGAGLQSPDLKEFPMRLCTQMIRLAIFAGLVGTAAVCGGWKWEGLPL